MRHTCAVVLLCVLAIVHSAAANTSRFLVDADPQDTMTGLAFPVESDPLGYRQESASGRMFVQADGNAKLRTTVIIVTVAAVAIAIIIAAIAIHSRRKAARRERDIEMQFPRYQYPPHPQYTQYPQYPSFSSYK
eukprot:GILJ01016992.1.p1 GENE.GILJ01016992.1~~GILJ01016992.1.p1  ORF type:complete len:134 (-),score=15.21 GILJ01016992.1:129-530(-)